MTGLDLALWLLAYAAWRYLTHPRLSGVRGTQGGHDGRDEAEQAGRGGVGGG